MKTSIGRTRRDLDVPGSGPSRWVTRERPQVERVACPWLIRRFIDERAQFFYVPPHDVMRKAAELGAVPFDIPGVELTHKWERCTFDALQDAFDLHGPALDRLACIVRAADTDRNGIAPQAAGLLAISMGLSRLYPNDHEMLDAGMLVYDALYEWCEHGQGEVHKWQAHEQVALPGTRA
ncbi:MAG TPA: chromate resistance protein ChrB domain-containing protein [Rubrivivax sp.]